MRNEMNFAEEVLIDDPESVNGLKAGLYHQTKAFIAAAENKGSDDRLCTLREAVENYRLFEGVLGYTDVKYEVLSNDF